MDKDEHIIGSQDTEVEALRFIDGYIAAIINHTGSVDSDEKISSLRQDFRAERIDDPMKEAQ